MDSKNDRGTTAGAREGQASRARLQNVFLGKLNACRVDVNLPDMQGWACQVSLPRHASQAGLFTMLASPQLHGCVLTYDAHELSSKRNQHRLRSEWQVVAVIRGSLTEIWQGQSERQG